MKKRDEFLKKLAALTAEYGIKIGGCGCCGSPYLKSLDSDDNDTQHKGRYVFSEDSGHVYWESYE